jgi:hypothetical protein
MIRISNGDQANEQGPYTVAGEIYGYSYATGKKKKKKSGGWLKKTITDTLASRKKQKMVDSTNTAAAIKAAGKSQGPAIKLAPLPKDTASKSMSPALKWGLIIGGGLLVIGGGYLLYKKFGKKHGK